MLSPRNSCAQKPLALTRCQQVLFKTEDIDACFSYGSGTVWHISFDRSLSLPLGSMEVTT